MKKVIVCVLSLMLTTQGIVIASKSNKSTKTVGRVSSVQLLSSTGDGLPW